MHRCHRRRAPDAAHSLIRVSDEFEGSADGGPDAEHLSSLQRLGSKAMEITDKLSSVGVDEMGPWKGSAQIADERLTQARLAGAIAHLRGYDIRSEEVRSVVLMSLIGSSATEALSQAGVQIGTKSALSAVKQVPGRVLIQINQAVGFRLITKRAPRAW